jgi:uncharacterized SAM-binding protein YcdF (DUF218 family)
VAALIVLVAVLAAATGRLFVWPAQGMAARADAIIVIGGPGDRLEKGLQLQSQGRAPVLAISKAMWFPLAVCLTPKVICFQPEPSTTQGEAELVGRLAKKYHWRSIALVTTPDQDTRARLRFGRCFNGSIYVVTTALPAWLWPYEIAYQWAASVKAEVWQRSC